MPLLKTRKGPLLGPLAKKTILTRKFGGQDRVQEKEILTQEVDEKTNIAPTHNNWCRNMGM
jgi:hypothetical protein